MLRRYIIVNGISTAVLYAGVWAFVPSMGSMTQAVTDAWDTFGLGHTFLGPVLHRIITVSASIL